MRVMMGHTFKTVGVCVLSALGSSECVLYFVHLSTDEYVGVIVYLNKEPSAALRRRCSKNPDTSLSYHTHKLLLCCVGRL